MEKTKKSPSLIFQREGVVFYLLEAVSETKQSRAPRKQCVKALFFNVVDYVGGKLGPSLKCGLFFPALDMVTFSSYLITQGKGR